MENHCLGCHKIWVSDKREHYCQPCRDYLSSLTFDHEISVIHKVSLGKGESINKGHLKDIQSRVIDDDGNSIKGKAGVAYMKRHEKEYAGRLKSYYETKI